MTRILVIYGTTDGHTRKVAECLGRMVRDEDPAIDVDIVHAGSVDVDPQDYDGIVVCASVHVGAYQRPVARWVRAHAGRLNRKRTAFVSVCLGVLQKDPKVDQDLDAIVKRFLAATGWQPARVKKIAGALLYRQYGLIKRWMMKRIVAKAGGDTDTSRNYEYTDWNDLRVFVGEFLRLVTPVREKALSSL
jgi:menaquinone-dependent protoporphyrinogen oxidase